MLYDGASPETQAFQSLTYRRQNPLELTTQPTAVLSSDEGHCK